MRKNAFSAIDHITKFNELKRSYFNNSLLNEGDLKNILKTCGVPSNSLFISELKKSGILMKVEDNGWTWKDKSPIHYQTLQNIYFRYRDRVNMYSKYSKKRRIHKEVEEAINLLKSYGFEIIIPHGKFYKKF